MSDYEPDPEILNDRTDERHRLAADADDDVHYYDGTMGPFEVGVAWVVRDGTVAGYQLVEDVDAYRREYVTEVPSR